MTWQLDPSHSNIEFSAKHMMIATVRGRFEDFTGTVNIDEQDLTNSTAEFTIQATSLNTHNEQRDGHLRGGDFFLAEEYPTITFKTTKITKAGSDYKVTGDLTIRGVTRSETFDAELNGPGKDPWGNTRYGVEVTGTINRKDYGLNWNVALETGGFLVGDQIKLNIAVQVFQPAAVPAGAGA